MAIKIIFSNMLEILKRNNNKKLAKPVEKKEYLSVYMSNSPSVHTNRCEMMIRKSASR